MDDTTMTPGADEATEMEPTAMPAEETHEVEETPAAEEPTEEHTEEAAA